MNAPQYTITHETITVILDGRPHTVRTGERNFKEVREAILDEAWEELPRMLVAGVKVEEWAKGDFRYDKGTHSLFYRDMKVDEAIAKRAVTMADTGGDPAFLLRFWERLQQNPSMRSVEQLYRFLEHKGIPIDTEGYFLAYKSVRRDYKDVHSGQFDNSPGKVLEMPRNQISDDPRKACHVGFHVGALGYANSFGPGDRRIIIVRVDPADVVCVPYDHSDQKMRVCKYEVVGLKGSELPDTTVKETEVEVKPHEKTEVPSAEVVAESKAHPESASWEYLIEASDEDLEKALLSNLRKYARHHLKIVGASKIPGGKPVLLEKIRDARDEG